MTKFKNHKEKTTILVKKLGSKAVKLQASSSKHIGKYLTRRASRIGDVRRFVASWLLLVLLLIIGTFAGLMQVRSVSAKNMPVAGGIYNEGMVGEVNNLNPLLNWLEAKKYCESLGKKWRLPTDSEFLYLIDFSSKKGEIKINVPSLMYSFDSTIDRFYDDINDDVKKNRSHYMYNRYKKHFPFYWTSVTSESDTSKAWVVNFTTGYPSLIKNQLPQVLLSLIDASC